MASIGKARGRRRCVRRDVAVRSGKPPPANPLGQTGVAPSAPQGEARPMPKQTRIPRSFETQERVFKGQDRPGLPWPIEMKRPADLKPALRNARTHTERQIDPVANSMLRFGVVNPVVIDRRDRIVAGHARWDAARRLNLKWIPVIRLEDLSDDELRAYALADNQIATKAGWNRRVIGDRIDGTSGRSAGPRHRGHWI